MKRGEPLNCPCCGSTATVEPHLIEAGCTAGDQVWADWWTASVNCTSCALQFVGGGDTEEEAVEDALKGWNTRAATTAQQFAWAVHDGRTWVCVEAATESDALKPIPGFTRDSIYRDSMQEYGEWMEKAMTLMLDMYEFMGTPSWCEERCELTAECDGQIYEVDCLMRGVFAERLREFGIEVER